MNRAALKLFRTEAGEKFPALVNWFCSLLVLHLLPWLSQFLFCRHTALIGGGVQGEKTFAHWAERLVGEMVGTTGFEPATF